jgi:hypothetical protein
MPATLQPYHQTRRTYRSEPMVLPLTMIRPGDIIRFTNPRGDIFIVRVESTVLNDNFLILEPVWRVTGPVVTIRKGRKITNGKRSTVSVLSFNAEVEWIGDHDRYIWD